MNVTVGHPALHHWLGSMPTRAPLPGGYHAYVKKQASKKRTQKPVQEYTHTYKNNVDLWKCDVDRRRIRPALQFEALSCFVVAGDEPSALPRQRDKLALSSPSSLSPTSSTSNSTVSDSAASDSRELLGQVYYERRPALFMHYCSVK